MVCVSSSSSETTFREPHPPSQMMPPQTPYLAPPPPPSVPNDRPTPHFRAGRITPHGDYNWQSTVLAGTGWRLRSGWGWQEV